MIETTTKRTHCPTVDCIRRDCCATHVRDPIAVWTNRNQGSGYLSRLRWASRRERVLKQPSGLAGGTPLRSSMPKLSVKGAVTRGVDGIGCVDACTRSGGTR